MAFDRKDNTGALFPNRRRDSETSPHESGDALIEGKLYRMIAWINQTKDGIDWRKVTFTPADEARPSNGNRTPSRDNYSYKTPGLERIARKGVTETGGKWTTDDEIDF